VSPLTVGIVRRQRPLADPLTPTLLGDAGRLRQVLLNRFGNAVNFTAAGHVVVHIGLNDTGGPGVVRFSGRDTEIGISPEVMARLFQPCAQGAHSTIRTYGGTGLGLAICKHLVELMGGEVGGKSALGHGSAPETLIAA
jgi:signal transduction histidine kinase